jgi:hypothetical protein
MDFDDITLGEIEEIEDYAGLAISRIGEEVPGVIKLRIALAWIIRRRTNPAFTIDDAKKMTAVELTSFFTEDPLKKD